MAYKVEMQLLWQQDCPVGLPLFLMKNQKR